MKFHQAFPSDWFKAADINGDGPVLTITAISTESMNDGAERRALSFKEAKKRLLLNRTNWLKTAEILGQDDDSEWVGCRIRLVKEKVLFKGERVDAVRVAEADLPF